MSSLPIIEGAYGVEPALGTPNPEGALYPIWYHFRPSESSAGAAAPLDAWTSQLSRSASESMFHGDPASDEVHLMEKPPVVHPFSASYPLTASTCPPLKVSDFPLPQFLKLPDTELLTSTPSTHTCCTSLSMVNEHVTDSASASGRRAREVASARATAANFISAVSPVSLFF